MSRWAALASALLVFLLVLVMRMPASWALHLLPAASNCAQVGGTIWQGSCTALEWHGRSYGDIAWVVHPAALTRGLLSLDLETAHGVADGHAGIALGRNGLLVIRDADLLATLDPARIPHLPPGLRGRAQLQIRSARIVGERIEALTAHVEAHDLVEQTGSVTRLGSYAIDFPDQAGGGEPVGALRDMGDGPLEVQGTLKLTRQPGFALDGLVTARASAPEELRNQLQFLGSPDAQGRHTFSLAGTW